MSSSPRQNNSLIERDRDLFPHIDDGYIYLNHASVSPLSTKVKDAIMEFTEQRHRTRIENLEEGSEIMSSCRKMIADLIHADSPELVAFTQNTSDGLSVAAEGLPLKAGDEILLNDMEFPSNVHPWRALERKGVRLKILKSVSGTIPVSIIEENITDKTSVIAISAVQFLSGYLADLKRIGALCKTHNIFFVVDGIQALGAVDINVSECNIDVLASGGHKWLISPLGAGFLYLNKPTLEVLTPVRTGWFSVREPWELLNYDQPWLQNALRLEAGTPNMLGITGMRASLKNLHDTGIAEVSNRINSITGYLIEIIQSHPSFSLYTSSVDSERAGIVTFKPVSDFDGDLLIENLKKEKISISHREGFLRMAPHYYNTCGEIETAFEMICRLIK